jgi:hypothetical protein
MSKPCEADMSESLGELAARKQLLVARSRLHRLQVQHEVRLLRQSLARPMTALSVATSPSVRPLLLGALTFMVGRGRLMRLVRRAMTALTVIKVARAAWTMFRQDANARRVAGSRVGP